MRKIIFIIIIGLYSIQSIAQTEMAPNFVGINPSVTIEPFYEKGELDVNVFPIVYQKALAERIDIRIATILNYGIRKTTNEISHFGGQLAFPIFLKKKEDLLLPSQGYFAAFGIGFTRNRIEEHTNIGFWLEPGYNLMISEKWSISFGIQFGATYFNYDNGIQKWGNHFGSKIIFGRWI